MAQTVAKIAGGVKKIFWSVVATFVLLIPLQMYLGARQLLNPEGFFVEVLIFGVGAYFLGLLQLVLLIILLFTLLKIWE